ncbi:hypothetical protein JG688_00007580 [Phytophthora aleatoria]|uniref:RxLR effector protein n=1 Tax=Phytophthora aleatoria TaxID=2496075 RepID=A0A8J5IVA9_9STRA|nr:hypothetical protein JG688_00007580 [Phytophthora aleatoria]
MLKKWLLAVCCAAVGLVATSADDLDARTTPSSRTSPISKSLVNWPKSPSSPC